MIFATANIGWLGMKIEEIGRQYPRAQIIASADIRMGFINR